MNRVLISMLKGAAKNPLVFAAVLAFVGQTLGEKVKQGGISEKEEILIGAVRGVHDVAHEFLTAVGEQPE